MDTAQIQQQETLLTESTSPPAAEPLLPALAAAEGELPLQRAPADFDAVVEPLPTVSAPAESELPPQAAPAGADTADAERRRMRRRLAPGLRVGLKLGM